MKLSEQELTIIVEKCKKQDRLSQRKIYEMFYGKMMAVCLRYARNSDDAKDILQDGFIKAFNKIDRYSFEGSFEGWLKRIIVNTAIDSYRRKKREVTIADDSLIKDDAIIDDEVTNKYEGLSINDIVDAMQQLSPGYRSVFNLYVMEGLTHKEIAETLNVSEGTSKSNFAKAKSNIKKILTKKINRPHE